MNKPKISSMGCFPEVEAALGFSQAQIELWKVVHCKELDDAYEQFDYESLWLCKLDEAFDWTSSPQGWDFWCEVEDKAYEILEGSDEN